MTKVRVLYVISDMGIGGAQKQVAEVMTRLDHDRFDTDLVCIETGGVNLEKVRGLGETFILNALRIYDNHGLAALARLASIIRRGRYDIVETYLPDAHFLCSGLLLGRRKPLLVASRRHMASLDPAWMTAVSPLLDASTRFSIANSRAVKNSISARYHISPSKIAVIPNAVGVPANAPDRRAARASFGICDGQYVVAAAASITPVKDYPTIIRAFAQLCAPRDAVLLIAGDGHSRASVVSCAKDLGLNGQVRFLGTVPDVAPVLSAADVFVHASLSEGFPNAILEAMAAGLPVVSSDIPSSREALGDCGLFFKPSDPAGCLAGLEAFTSTQLASVHGTKARTRVQDNFGDKVITRRERLYENLVRITNANCY